MSYCNKTHSWYKFPAFNFSGKVTTLVKVADPENPHSPECGTRICKRQIIADPVLQFPKLATRSREWPNCRIESDESIFWWESKLFFTNWNCTIE